MPPSLKDFLVWYLGQPVAILGIGVCGPGPVLLDNLLVSTLCLFRSAPYQVELVVLKPGSAPWPGEHRHPHVDSFEVDVFNSFDFTKNGVDVTEPEEVLPYALPYANGTSVLARCVRLLPSDWHGARCRSEGAALLSLQKWADDVEPTSIGLDWEGQPVHETHRQQQEAYA